MKNLKRIIAAAMICLMVMTFTIPAFASWEDEPDYSVTGDFPENVNVVIYGGADFGGLGDYYAAQYADIVGNIKNLVVRIKEETTAEPDKIYEDYVYKELTKLDCKTTFTIDYSEPDCGVYFFNDTTESFSKMNAAYADGKYTFEVDTVYPGFLFLSKYELSDDETVSQQTFEDSETGVKAEGNFMNGTFMETDFYNDVNTEYKVVFGRNFNLLDKVDAKIYLPCENAKAKAGFMDSDNEVKFIDFDAKYSNGYLIVDTKDISIYELQDIFVGTDEEIVEYIRAYNEEGLDDDSKESSQESSTKENKLENSKTEVQNQSSVNTGDSSNIVVIMIVVLTAVCVIIFAPIVRKSK